MRNGRHSLDQLLSDLSQLAALPDSAALSMPAGAYASDEMFGLEVRRVFEHEWVPLGRAEEVAEPGDYFTTELAGDALLVVRGDDRRIRVLSNVCRHKWTEVAQGQGNARVFVCPYHAWTYARDGRLVGARYMDRTEGFRMEDCRLPEIRSEIWRGFIFVNLDPHAEPLAPRLAKLEPHIERHHMQDMRRFTGATRSGTPTGSCWSRTSPRATTPSRLTRTAWRTSPRPSSPTGGTRTASSAPSTVPSTRTNRPGSPATRTSASASAAPSS